MLRTNIKINVIKNISSIISGAYSYSSGVQTTTIQNPPGTGFVNPNGTIQTSTTMQTSSNVNFPNFPAGLPNNFNYSAATTGSLSNFQINYARGEDVSFEIDFANNIQVDHSYKDMTKKCKITLPRNMSNVKNLYLLITEGTITIQNNKTINSVPLFGRGDRIIVSLGYDEQYTEVFRGYITKASVSTPVQLECEDSMFLLQNMQFNYSSTSTKCPPQKGNDITSLLSSQSITGNTITLQKIIRCMLDSDFNGLLTQGNGQAQNYFDFSNFPNIYPTSTGNPASNKDFGINRTDGKIPIYFDSGIDSFAFTYNTKINISISEALQDLKKSNPFLVFYFDDFYNFRIGTQFSNSGNTFISDTPVNFYFDGTNGNIIDEKNMKLQRADEMNVQIVMKSKQTKTKKVLTASSNPNVPTLGYYGSPGGNQITINADNDLSQDILNQKAAQMYFTQVYNGWARDSSFTTFGLPIVSVGNKVNLTSLTYPEKNGVFMVTGVKRIMGMNGYRQIIQIGAKV
jgi:hypothetical protein